MQFKGEKERTLGVKKISVFRQDHALISVSGRIVRLSKPARPNAIKRRIESVVSRRVACARSIGREASSFRETANNN